MTYAHFCEVHAILFREFYPWAGQDRCQLGVATQVSKGGIVDFEQAALIGKAVQWGLDMGNDAKRMRQHAWRGHGRLRMGASFSGR